MEVIYRPSGRAKEYAPLAVNLYETCPHACAYPCYVPGALHKRPKDFFKPAVARQNILQRMEKDAKKLAGCTDEIQLCFGCDPYPAEFQTPEDDITRQALLILEKYKLTATVLTKGGTRAMRDFDILKRNGWKFGSTVHLINPCYIDKWEPGTKSYYESRSDAIIAASRCGISTWVSLEPVIVPQQAIMIIYFLREFVDFWKIGKWNHSAEAKNIDWKAFLRDVRKILGGRPHMIKEDLLKAAAER